MQLVKIIKKTNNKIEQAKTILSIFCLLSDIRLSEVEKTVLSFFMVYGINEATKALIIKSQINTADSFENTKSKLKKFGLIKKNAITKQHYLNERLNIKFDSEVGMLIKIDNK